MPPQMATFSSGAYCSAAFSCVLCHSLRAGTPSHFQLNRNTTLPPAGHQEEHGGLATPSVADIWSILIFFRQRADMMLVSNLLRVLTHRTMHSPCSGSELIQFTRRGPFREGLRPPAGTNLIFLLVLAAPTVCGLEL